MTAGSAVPQAIDALVAMLPGAVPAGVTVSDGQAVTGQIGDFLFVGADDPDAAMWVGAQGSTVPGPASTQHKRDETGAITLVAVSTNGDGIQKTARDAVFAMYGAVVGLVKADPGLGLSASAFPLFQIDAVTHRLVSTQGVAGGHARLLIDLQFTARIV